MSAAFSGEVGGWARRHGGKVLSRASCLIRERPDTVAHIDLTYFPPGMLQTGDKTWPIRVLPLLAVEIVDVRDRAWETRELVGEYRAAGIPHVWVVHPRARTVLVHRPDSARPTVLTGNRTLRAEPDLPGLSIPLAEIFED